jgi:hypothetical protein
MRTSAIVLLLLATVAAIAFYNIDAPATEQPQASLAVTTLLNTVKIVNRGSTTKIIDVTINDRAQCTTRPEINPSNRPDIQVPINSVTDRLAHRAVAARQRRAVARGVVLA